MAKAWRFNLQAICMDFTYIFDRFTIMEDGKFNQTIHVQLQISEKLYLRDPQGTELGRKIIAQSAVLISEIGFEQFNFKRLAKKISSTEVSVYRYFDNKHRLLIYLISWYWNWLSYRLRIETLRIDKPKEKLQIAVELFCHSLPPLPNTQTIFDFDKLKSIVTNESPKAYLTKEVDEDNKEGAFLAYKRFCLQVAGFVREMAPEYAYPTALISTAVEAAHHQKFFSEHLPSLTEVSRGDQKEVAAYLHEMIFAVIGQAQNGDK